MKFGDESKYHFNGRWVEHYWRVALAKMISQTPPLRRKDISRHPAVIQLPLAHSFCSAPDNYMSCHQLWRMGAWMAQWELHCECPRLGVRDMEKAIKTQLIFIF